MADGKLAVCENKNYRVQIFNVNGLPEVVIDNQLNRNLHLPWGLCSGMDGRLLTVTNRTEVHFYNYRGMSLNSVEVHGKKIGCLKAVSLLDRDRMVVSTCGNNPGVYVLDIGGKTLATLKGGFLQPNYLSTDPTKGLVAVSDSELRTVQLFDVSGKRRAVLGDYNNPGPFLSWPTGVAFNDKGNLLVVDQVDHSVAEYTNDGRYIHDVLTGEHGLKNPLDIAVDNLGRLGVCSQWYDYQKNNYSVQVFVPESGRRQRAS